MLSLNYIMEIHMSLYYYNFIKFYVSFDIPKPQSLVFILISHFLTESIETNIKFTSLYYKYIVKMNQNKCNCCKCSIFSSFHDNSSIIEWRTRLTMDIFARFICSTLLTIIYITLFLCYGKNRLKNDFDIDYKSSIIFTSIYGGIDIIYYCLTIIIVKYYYQFDMIHIFIKYVNMFIHLGIMEIFIFLIVLCGLTQLTFF